LRADTQILGQFENFFLQSKIKAPVSGKSSRYFVEASLTVFKFNSAEEPPMTMAR
jgi:hypothetical protein